jgi:threonyl-tRNA synthetase
MVRDYYATFGFEDYKFRLSLWDSENTDKYIGLPENWETTQNHLRRILDDLEVPYDEGEGEAAFYGPKVDAQFTTLLGREESMSTIQLDFAAKDRFDLTFMDETGGENSGVFVIHRAPLSTHERFVAFLTEHWAGNFPTWLSPIQAQVITISEKQSKYGAKVAETLERAGIRTKTDFSDNTIGKKIRTHRKMRPAYMLIIGGEESKKETVAIRSRNGKQRNGVILNDFVNEILEEIKSRSSELNLVPS